MNHWYLISSFQPRGTQVWAPHFWPLFSLSQNPGSRKFRRNMSQSLGSHSMGCNEVPKLETATSYSALFSNDIEDIMLNYQPTWGDFTQLHPIFVKTQYSETMFCFPQSSRSVKMYGWGKRFRIHFFPIWDFHPTHNFFSPTSCFLQFIWELPPNNQLFPPHTPEIFTPEDVFCH